jgi:hypothetical protein
LQAQIVLYIELPADKTAGSPYESKRVRYGTYLLGIRLRKRQTGLVARSKPLPLAMIRQGDTQVSALLPSGNGAPHPSYYKRRERSVVRKICPSLGEPLLLSDRIGERPWPGLTTRVCPSKRRMFGLRRYDWLLRSASTSRESWFNGSDGIASRENRGTRQIGKAQPNSDEYE